MIFSRSIRRAFALASLALATGCQSAPRSAPISVVESQALTPDSVRLYYRVAGEGPETVIAPFALYHESALDSLAVGRRIVTYDPRGRGRSDSVPANKVSLTHLLLDLETVRRAVGADSVALIGWSGGGMETFIYALRNPGRVTRLVHLAPVAPRFVPYGEQMMRDREQRTDTVARAAFRRRIAAGEFRNDPAAECRASAVVNQPALFADPARMPATPDVCRFPNEHLTPLGAYFGALFRSIDGYDWRDSLAAVAIPRLVIHGARDNIPLAGNEEWVTGQPNARIVVMDSSGHWPHYEQPAATISAIETFLRGQWPANARQGRSR
jgi:pimeloyl-ACP methyl ester carboxylesterase